LALEEAKSYCVVVNSLLVDILDILACPTVMNEWMAMHIAWKKSLKSL
jgi:hypothetical protein